MSNDFFKVKKGINLTPVDTSTISDSERGDFTFDDVSGKPVFNDGTEWKEVGSGSGSTQFEINQVAHGLAVGDGIYHNGTSWVKAQADNVDTLAYYVVIAVADVDNFTAGDFGRIEALSHGFTIGEYYFLSDSVAGQPTITEPTSGFSNPLFYVEDANTLQLKVYRPSGVDLDSNQTLQNKTLDNSNVLQAGVDIQTPSIINPVRLDVKKDTLANLQTYALTASNGQFCYAEDIKKMFEIKDGALSDVGSGSGDINYVQNSQFNEGIDGVTDSVNIIASHETVSPLRGDGSLRLSKAAVDASGQEVVLAEFTIDDTDLAKMLTISFDKDASHVGYNDGYARIRIKQDPNGTPSYISVNGEDIKAGKASYLAQFQTDHTIKEYQLVLEQVDTGLVAYELLIDNIKVGPKSIVRGAIVTKWEEFTMTITGSTSDPTKATSPAVDKAYWRRVGDSMQIKYDYQHDANTGAAAGSGRYEFNLPSGYSIDTSKLGGVVLYNTVGSATIFSTSTSHLTGYIAYRGDPNSLTLVGGDDVQTPNEIGSTLAPLTDAAIRYSFLATVPIQGWEAEGTLAEDLGGSQVIVEGAGNGGGSITASVTDIDFTETRDTSASWNGTQFTVPSTGEYSVVGHVFFTGSAVRWIGAYVDPLGVGSPALVRRFSGNLSSDNHAFSGNIKLNKGDILSFRDGGSGGTLLSNTTLHHIKITKLASGSQKFETATVAARYTSNAGTTLTAATTVDIPYEDIDYDTHGAYNTSTGEYTVTVRGKYKIKASYLTASTAMNGGSRIKIEVYKNGSPVSGGYSLIDTTRTAQFFVEVNDVLDLVVGDVIKIRGESTDASSISNDSIFNVFSIARIK